MFVHAALCTVLAAAVLVLAAHAQGQCDTACTGTTVDGTPFDLSALKGTDFVTQGHDTEGEEYYLNVCGVSATQCPDDAGDPPVTTGSAVQTTPSGCFVLGAFQGNNCLWTADPEGVEGLELVLNDGSNDLCADGTPRQVTMDFVCPPTAGPAGPLVPEIWTAVNQPGSCQYTYMFETCAACRGGCMSPPPEPTPSPSAGPDGPVTPILHGPGAFGWICIVLFGMLLPAYVLGGFAYNYQTKGLRGLAALPPPLNRLAGPPQRGPQDWTQPSTAYGGVDAGVDSL